MVKKKVYKWINSCQQQKGTIHRQKKKYFLFLGGYHKLLAVIKNNSELYSVDNWVVVFQPELELIMLL